MNISCSNIVLTFPFFHLSSVVISLWERQAVSLFLLLENPFHASIHNCLTRKRRAALRAFRRLRTISLRNLYKLLYSLLYFNFSMKLSKILYQINKLPVQSVLPCYQNFALFGYPFVSFCYLPYLSN